MMRGGFLKRLLMAPLVGSFHPGGTTPELKVEGPLEAAERAVFSMIESLPADRLPLRSVDVVARENDGDWVVGAKALRVYRRTELREFAMRADWSTGRLAGLEYIVWDIDGDRIEVVRSSWY